MSHATSMLKRNARFRELLALCVLALVFLSGCDGQSRSTVDGVCGGTAPSSRYFGWMNSRPRAASVADIAVANRDIEIDVVRSWYTLAQLECFAEQGDQLAGYIVASEWRALGEHARAEMLVRRMLPELSNANDADTTCDDPALPSFVDCPAGLPENWLLFGDLVLDRATSADAVAEAEAAFRRAGILDVSLSYSGIVAAHLQRANRARERLNTPSARQQ